MRTYLIYPLWSTLLFFCYDCQDVHIYPSPTAEVKIGEALILNCTYTGNNTPVTVKWYLNNDAVGMIVLLTTCNILGTPGTAYEVPRYTINCSTLTIKNITENDINDTWGCNVGFALGPPPNVSKTVITKATSTTISTTATTTNTSISTTKAATDTTIAMTATTTSIVTTKSEIGARENIMTASCTPPVIVIIDVIVSCILFILLIIIIVCCCCCLFCRKEEEKNKSGSEFEHYRKETELKQTNDNKDVKNETGDEDASPKPVYGVSNTLIEPSTCDELPVEGMTLRNEHSESEPYKLTQNAPLQ